jgi:tRNA-2-methylthio-N6-dimethylallyladenosine synthase
VNYFLKTYGCQMNVHDSEFLAGVLEAHGLQPSLLADADLVVLNTCSVRDNAEQKVRSFLGKLRARPITKPNALVIVAGCMAARVRHDLSRQPEVAMVCGPEELEAFPVRLTALLEERGFPFERPPSSIPYKREASVRAYVNITLGCDNFCTYCVVPYLRGRERSRPLEEILQEVRDLVRGGFPEVVFLGQNVNAYGKDLPSGDFAALLTRTNAMEGLRRIRYTTSHPRDFSRELVKTIRGLPKICEHFHLPLQAGSNQILAAMHRDYTREQYLDLVSFIRTEIPTASITTDLIVGFPGEQEQDFDQTLDLMRQIRFDNAHILTYSPRPGTAAFSLGDPVPPDEKDRRLQILMTQHEQDARFRNQMLVGQTLEVLVEGVDPKRHRLLGRTRTDKLIAFIGSESLVGQFINVLVEKAYAWSLEGSPL